MKGVVHVELRQMSGIDEARHNTDTQTVLQQDKLIPTAESSHGLTNTVQQNKTSMSGYENVLLLLLYSISKNDQFQSKLFSSCVYSLFPIIIRNSTRIKIPHQHLDQNELVYFERNQSLLHPLSVLCNLYPFSECYLSQIPGVEQQF